MSVLRTLLIACLVAYLAVTRKDVQTEVGGRTGGWGRGRWPASGRCPRGAGCLPSRSRAKRSGRPAAVPDRLFRLPVRPRPAGMARLAGPAAGSAEAANHAETCAA